ncbi:MAG: ATP-binding protein [Desulfoprunum sp.]|nr:ATP-binding protein [Desulfoprunum sp.]
MRSITSTFLDWPIRRKLLAIVLFTSGLLISLMAVSITIEKYYSYKAKLVKNTSILATIIGANCTAALTFRDENTASELIAGLKAEKDLIAARLFDGNGALFVSYINPHFSAKMVELPDRLVGDDVKATPYFAQRYFDVVQPIILEEKPIGFILLRTDLASLNKQLQVFIVVIIGFSLLLFGLGHLICSRLNRTITEPVAKLAATMQDITRNQNFELRVEKLNNDEIGVLIDGFNTMLAQIQKRDTEIAEHQNRLEELVDSRTHELKVSNEQLLQEIVERQEIQAKLAHAQKMEAIGTLAGGVAHDLNNILSGIVSYPDLLLLDLPAGSPLRKPIETIRLSGRKAAAIVQDLLTLARRGVKVEESINLQKLIYEYLESPECAELLKNHPRVKIVFPGYGTPFTMVGSPIHISKTLMNLVANAAEAMPDGGEIHISLEDIYLDTRPVDFKQWQERMYIRLTISDAGIGIPEQFIDRIFEPFYSRKVMGRSGTGLGMAVVWGTVEDHKGYITVASEEGKGTTFQIFFPRALSEDIPTHPVMKEEPLQGYGQTVLVVDDSEDQRQIATDILNYLGYIATSVESGETAVQYLKQHSADLILLDMLMAPGIDGLETYKQILSFRPHQKAIIASGYSQSEPIQIARKLGVSEYIIKPYTVLRIGQAVHTALARE